MLIGGCCVNNDYWDEVCEALELIIHQHGANLKPALFIEGNDVSNSSGKILCSNIGCKKNIIENGAIMGEDVIL